MERQKIYTPKQVARMKNCSVRRIQKMCQEGVINALKLGENTSGYIIYESELNNIPEKKKATK